MSNDAPKAHVDRGVGDDAGYSQLERLWAPYRQQYLTESPRAKDGSGSHDPFVDAPKQDDAHSRIIGRGDHVYVILNLFPYNAGHLMVIPYRKVSELEDLSTEEANEMMAFAQKAVRVLKEVSRPDACNIGMNLGQAAGGSVADHLHMHIVPRWVGDTSFMPILGGAKVMPATLDHTWQLLHEAWERLDA